MMAPSQQSRQPPQPIFRQYQPWHLIALTALTLFAFILAVNGVGFGTSLVIVLALTMLVIDWRGARTLRGLIIWSSLSGWRKWLTLAAYILLLPITYIAYLVQAWRTSPQVVAKAHDQNGQLARRNIGIVAISLLIPGLFGVLVVANSGASNTIQSTQGTIGNRVTTSSATPKPKSTPKPKLIAISSPRPQLTATPNPKLIAISSPRSQLTATPNPKLIATSTPRSQPTATPAPQPPTATPLPYPAVNNNPWDYNFQCCNHISIPPSDFCNWFNCIPSFWKGHGYVAECNDSTFSLSGGIQGACSYHDGEWRPLLAP